MDAYRRGVAAILTKVQANAIMCVGTRNTLFLTAARTTPHST
jgi:hypothetical protein